MTMTTTRRLAVLAAATAALATGCVAARGADTAVAGRLLAPEAEWIERGIEASDSTPGTFVVRLRADMPTPGWAFVVDDVTVDPEAGRIVARVTERAPGGLTSQVITPTDLEIEVGPLAPGRWVFELRTRRDPDAEHAPRWARVLLAV